MKEIHIEIPSNQIEVIEDYFELTNLKPSSMDLNDGSRLFILKVEDHVTNNLLHELKARGVGTVFGSISILQLSMHLDSVFSENKIPVWGAMKENVASMSLARKLRFKKVLECYWVTKFD